jgi:CheY-like chemotaxis protein
LTIKIQENETDCFRKNPTAAPFTKLKSNSKLQIAIVEDVPGLLDTYVRILQALGHEVVATAFSGEQMLESLTDIRVRSLDMAIIDYRLGSGMDGLTLANLLMEKNPNIKIVMATADNDWIRTEAKNHGLAVLSKPFSLREFRSLISS